MATALLQPHRQKKKKRFTRSWQHWCQVVNQHQELKQNLHLKHKCSHFRADEHLNLERKSILYLRVQYLRFSSGTILMYYAELLKQLEQISQKLNLCAVYFSWPLYQISKLNTLEITQLHHLGFALMDQPPPFFLLCRRNPCSFYRESIESTSLSCTDRTVCDNERTQSWQH